MLLRIGILTVACATLPQIALAEKKCDFLSEDYFTRASVGEDVVACLEQGYSFAIQDTANGNTPLHLAAKQLNDPFLIDQIAVLIPAEIREKLVSVPNNEGPNPFHLAVQAQRSTASIAKLARWGDVVDSVFDEDTSTFFATKGTTSLHLAMKGWTGTGDEVDRVLALLALGATTNISDSDGKTPLGLAKTDDYVAALLLDAEVWRERVQDDVVSLMPEEIGRGETCRSEVLKQGSLPVSTQEAWNCVDALLRSRSSPEDFWNLLERGDNFLHRLIKSSPPPKILDAVLASAEENNSLEEALSAENIDGHTPLHLAAQYADDPLTVVQLVRWGGNVDKIAGPKSNGLLKETTGETALHFAARRQPAEEATRFIAALIAMGAETNIYDNNFDGNPLGDELGLQAIDYMNKNANFSGLSLVGPGFSFCEKVDESKTAVLTALGVVSTAAATSGGAVIATTTAGITAVTHSSGAIILTGSSGYIAGTLGAASTTLVAVLTAPATLAAAGTTIVVAGGSVLYCSQSS